MRLPTGRKRGAASPLIDPDIPEADLQSLHDGGIRGVRFGFVSHLASRPDLANYTPHDRAHCAVWLACAAACVTPPTWSNWGRFSPHCRCRSSSITWDASMPGKVWSNRRSRNFWNSRAGTTAGSSYPEPTGCRAQGDTFDDAVPFAQALLDAAPERALWGTDYPHRTRATTSSTTLS